MQSKGKRFNFHYLTHVTHGPRGLNIPSLREPCKFPSTPGCRLPAGRQRAGPGNFSRPGNALLPGHWHLHRWLLVACHHGRQPGEPRLQKPQWVGRGLGEGLPRQARAQQESSSSSARSRDAAAAGPGDRCGRRVATGSISAPAGGSGLRTLRCPSQCPGSVSASLVRARWARPRN